MSDGRGVRGIPYAFAGLSEVRKDKATRETKETFTIITTDPNEVMRGLDDRMSVILYRKDYVQWMAPADPAQVPVNLLRPCPAVDMKGCKVGPDVGNVRNNRPGLCDPSHVPARNAVEESVELAQEVLYQVFGRVLKRIGNK